MYKYKRIRISRSETRDEHRIIMEKAINRTLSFNECVHHKNGNKRDNRLENLEIISRSEHMKLHKISGDIVQSPVTVEGRKRIREVNSKLTEQQVIEIRNSSDRNKELASKYNVSKFVISRVRTNRTWKEIN